MGALKFEIGLGSNSMYRFQIVGQDGAVIVSSRGFQNKDACMEGIRAVKENSLYTERYTKKKLDGGKTGFSLKSPGHQVVVEGGPYDDMEKCEAAIAIIRLANQAAVIER